VVVFAGHIRDRLRCNDLIDDGDVRKMAMERFGPPLSCEFSLCSSFNQIRVLYLKLIASSIGPSKHSRPL
jgi:hypothetical protein